MGTKGESGIKGNILGSFTNNIILISPCPVFTIPMEGKYDGIKSIVCATEMDKSEMKAIESIISLSQNFNAHILFYNVNSNNEEQKKLSDQFKHDIEELTEYNKIDYYLNKSNDKVKAIENFVCENHPDLLVTLGKKRSFFDKILAKKLLKTFAYILPFLYYHFPAERSEKMSLSGSIINAYFLL